MVEADTGFEVRVTPDLSFEGQLSLLAATDKASVLSRAAT